MGNDKLARPRHPARPAAFGKFKELPHSGDNPGIDFDRRTRAVRFEVFEDRVAVGQGLLRLDQPQRHGRPFVLRSAEARRSANCAST
jgi:hypothetical protein